MSIVVVLTGRLQGNSLNFVDEGPSCHNLSYTRDVGAAAFIIAVRVQLLRDTGAALSPFNAFLLLQRLETLSLRVERHVQNAETIVDFLVNHPKVEKINYPKLADSPYHALAEKYLPKGVTPNQIHLSIGLENVDDLIEDLRLALEKI